MAREWKDRKGLSRLSGLAGWSSLSGFWGLAAPGSLEQRYLRWSRARAALEVAITFAVVYVVSESLAWVGFRGLPFKALLERWAYMLGKDLPLPAVVEIPAGSFMMGSELNKVAQPVHRVTFVQPFYLGRTEVTFEQWDACVADGGCYGYRPADLGRGRGNRSVINVSWGDAQAYVAWLGQKRGSGCRLPSEAEWEYAARAGTTTDYAGPVRRQGMAECGQCGSQWDFLASDLVGQYAANSWGLHDMHGLVWEWVEDCVHNDYSDAPEDGRAWGNGGNCSYRVSRGGCQGDVQDARSTYRSQCHPAIRSNNIGFRVVCSSPSSDTDP